MHPRQGMQVDLDIEQAQVLREMLENTLTQLRVESARADSRAFRLMLHHREEVVEAMLTKMKD
jgi:hypothetical protein